MIWLRLIFTLGQTAAATMAWQTWLHWKLIERSYTPEVLAAASFHIPRSALWEAWMATILAAVLWWALLWRVKE